MSNSKKRYISKITVYTYGDTPQEAFNEGESMCEEINFKYDCHACVEEIHEQPFGSLESTKIDISNLKN